MAKRRRTVGVVTGARADYGLLRWTIFEIAKHRDLDLKLIVTGMHLAPQFGETWKEIEADGNVIDARVDMLLASDMPSSMSRSTGLGVIGMTDALTQLAPDIVLLLGDRFETLAAASAAMLMRLPIAHIHGGEVTEGAVDESIRHAITKMSHLHFVSNEEHQRRVIQLGESPDRVFCVGAPGLDHLTRLDLKTREELSSLLRFDLSPQLFVVTYHPATLGAHPPEESLKYLLDALDAFPEARCLITKANADIGGQAINRALEAFVAKRPDRARLTASLGHINYLSALTLADVVIGNSSSGLIEAPSAGTPTVNIGDRQKGRSRAASVIDCAESTHDIKSAIARALSPEMQSLAAEKNNPYRRHGDVAKQIVAEIVDRDLGSLYTKPFHDIV